MAAGSSLESWVGQSVSVELAADPGSEGSIAILRGGGLEARLEGVSEYGLMLLMVRYDELRWFVDVGEEAHERLGRA